MSRVKCLETVPKNIPDLNGVLSHIIHGTGIFTPTFGLNLW